MQGTDRKYVNKAPSYQEELAKIDAKRVADAKADRPNDPEPGGK